MPLIWRNRIEQCIGDGIIVSGLYSEPDIRGNVIANNRNCGIKLMNFGSAHIGGNSKLDIEELPDMPKLEMHLPFN